MKYRKCKYCQHEWAGRQDTLPKRCPRCQKPYAEDATDIPDHVEIPLGFTTIQVPSAYARLPELIAAPRHRQDKILLELIRLTLDSFDAPGIED